jgi:hypothetical protein
VPDKGGVEKPVKPAKHASGSLPAGKASETRAVRRKKKPAARNGPRGRLPGRGGILGALDNWKRGGEMEATKVRPDSRAAAAVKALLDHGDLNPVPGCFLEMDTATARLSAFGVGRWAKAQGMDLRSHDLEEMEDCIAVIQGKTLERARGRWAAATGYAQDFAENGGAPWNGSIDPEVATSDVIRTHATVVKLRKEAERLAKQADEYDAQAATATDKYALEQAPLRRAAAADAADDLAVEEVILAESVETKRNAFADAAKKPRYA